MNLFLFLKSKSNDNNNNSSNNNNSNNNNNNNNNNNCSWGTFYVRQTQTLNPEESVLNPEQYNGSHGVQILF